LRHDQQPDRRTPRDERLLDRSSTGDELLIGTQRVRRRQARLAIGRRRPERPRPTVRGSARASVTVPAAIPIPVAVLVPVEGGPALAGSSWASRGWAGSSRTAVEATRFATRRATERPRTGWPRWATVEVAAIRSIVRAAVVWLAVR
jgi:hypothetical protein